MAKRPRDPNQLAKLIVDIVTGKVADTISAGKKSPPRHGRAGGLKGGRARAKRLSPIKRKAIAKKAALARWKRSPK